MHEVRRPHLPFSAGSPNLTKVGGITLPEKPGYHTKFYAWAPDVPVGLLDFAVQRGNSSKEVFAQIVTAAEVVVGYSIDLQTLNATELWRLNVTLYGPAAKALIADEKKFRPPGKAGSWKVGGHPTQGVGPRVWPASIAVNKKYMLVTQRVSVGTLISSCWLPADSK